ncbi:MAG: phosphoserine phosphatase SerB [Euryarchaeota archaeon]|nr:phosphoserine phosphatase SerB [Euryarchaeota archaeon]
MNCPIHDSAENKLIVFDMDSTFKDAETIDELARAADLVSKVGEITKRATHGYLDFEQALAERVRLLEGLSPETALDAVDQINLMPEAAELVLYVKSWGYRTAMISAGFITAATRIGKTPGIDFVVSKKLLVEDGYLTGEVVCPVTQSDSKAKVFKELVRLYNVRPDQCLLVGDGAKDACIFEIAGFAIAFNPEPILREYADVVITVKNLRTVILFLNLFLINVVIRHSMSTSNTTKMPALLLDREVQ